MAVPVVTRVAECYPDTDITVLSRMQSETLWRDMPQNVHFAGADFKGRHKGISGMQRLMQDIDYRRFDAVADLHDVLRSLWIDRKFLMQGKKVAIIHKGRFRKWLTVNHLTGNRSLSVPMLTTVQRYEAVFARLGLVLPPDTGTLANDTPDSEKKGIGIAPFAAHKGKIYPTDKMEEVVRLLSEQLSATEESIYLFGAGESEKSILERWEKKYKGVISLAGKYAMNEEIAIMRGLRLMLTMDSANMHLASLAGTRVLSVWGATHPALGFLGYGQKEEDCIQRDLPCRPCSVYGNRNCRYRDYRCLNIPPENIAERVMQAIS